MNKLWIAILVVCVAAMLMGLPAVVHAAGMGGMSAPGSGSKIRGEIKHCNGPVVGVDVKNNTLVVQTSDTKKETFVMDENTQLLTNVGKKESGPITLSNITVGAHVYVAYVRDTDGKTQVLMVLMLVNRK